MYWDVCIRKMGPKQNGMGLSNSSCLRMSRIWNTMRRMVFKVRQRSHSFCFRTTAHPHQAAWGGLWAAGNVKVWGKAWILESPSYSLSAQHAGDSDFFSWTTMRADTALHLFSFIFLCACPWVRATEVISALLAFSTVASRNEIKSGAEMPNTWLTKEMLLL